MFTKENCEGYTNDEMIALNREFAERYINNEFSSDDLATAEQEFSDEVARR